MPLYRLLIATLFLANPDNAVGAPVRMETWSEKTTDADGKVVELKPNPAYPKTTPKGGTGKGIWIR